REYAVLKTLGFTRGHVIGLIAGESLMISAIGGAIGLALTFPLTESFAASLPSGWFPVFEVTPLTITLAACSALLVGVLAAVFPAWRAVKTRIVDGLREVG
ncbi:MAG: FtsX-like permease family protein, partial [Ignavibacteria bacterium]|nr:FtsX-like permease family protein [Ignavibacteria bacterium]